MSDSDDKYKDMPQSRTDHEPPVRSLPSAERLEKAVMIPQRRPKNKSRRWALAYAPTLNDCGIGQPTFVDFLDTLKQASKVSRMTSVV